MSRARLFWLFLSLLAIGSLLLAWTLFEARAQSQAAEASLTDQASVLSQSLGPGLVAAAHAARELEEIIGWKLLDNARLLAELAGTSFGADRLADLARENGLDSVVVFGPDGRLELAAGERLPPEIRDQLALLFDGRADEIVIGSTLHEGIEHLGAAARGPTGAVVFVRVHASSAHVYSRRLGVPNLLERLVGTGGVLYLSYRDEPGPILASASWDGGPVPPEARAGLRGIRGRTAFEIELPLASPAGREASLRVGLDGDPLGRTAATARRRTLLVGLVLLGFAAAAAGLAFVERLRSFEREEARSQLARAERDRRQSERLVAAGALAAGLAHEVRSPLNAIGLAAQRLERKLGPRTEDLAIARRIRSEVVRLENVLHSFLDLASPVSADRELADLRDIAAAAVDLLRDEAGCGGVAVSLEPGFAPATLDRDAVHRAVLNLVRNAIQASPEGGTIVVKTMTRNGHAVVEVLDEGTGLPPELADRLFDPFVSSRASGTGLGLPLVRRVAEEHGGSVQLENRRRGGAVASLALPLARGS